MSAKPCARLWQIEAARDDRLTGKDLASALRHRETCAECTAEAARVSELATGIAQLPAEPLDAITARRVRQRLLTAFNASVLDPAPARAFPRFAGLLACALVGALGVICFWVGRARAPAAPPTSPSPAVEIQASSGARFSDRVEPRLERVEFDDGSAALTVHPHTGRRVLIELPDGEIEDLGTIFQLRVEDGRTQQISVTDGRIAVRLREQPPFSLGAGETWQREAPRLPAVVATSPAITSSATPSRVVQSAHVATHERAHPLSALPSPALPIEARHEGPSADNTNAEDDAYLGIIDSLRGGRGAEARARAKDYLLRFPNGFRRVEVLNIATRGADAGSN